MNNFVRTTGYVLIAYIAGVALYNYGFRLLGWGSWPPLSESYQLHPIGLYTHIFAAVLALVVGPFQFSVRLRQKFRQLHRWMGRAYLGIGVLVGGISGLYMSVFAFGGLAAKLGFAGLAIAWLYTGCKAYQSIRAGNVEEHKAWMIRNYALTLAAVSFRVYLPLSMMAGFDFETVYRIDAWACWIPNLLVAEWMISRRSGQWRIIAAKSI